MTAAQSIKTPVMNLPLREATESCAHQLTSRLRRISLAECLTGEKLISWRHLRLRVIDSPSRCARPF